MRDSARGNEFTRRDFAKAAAIGAAGVGIGLSNVSRKFASAAEAKSEAEAKPEGQTKSGEAKPSKIPLRKFGKTGLEVTEISLGAMEVSDPAVVEKSIDDGCNYIDTAASYQKGRNETMIGEIMARRRKEVFLATKFSEDDKEGVFRSVDRSLQRLQTDHVDIIQYHGATKADEVKKPYVKEAFDELKKQGKVRFLGYTTHGGQIEVLNACIEVGYVDTVLVGYSFTCPEELTEAVKKARDAGIGIAVMKGIRGAKDIKETASGMTKYQQALRWLLDKPFVDTVPAGMTSLQHVDEDLKASQLKLTAFEKLNLKRVAIATASKHCSGCNNCDGCPRGVKPMEIMRAHMYAYTYGNVPKAREEFAAMGGPAMLAACTACGQCEKKCSRNLKIRERYREVASLMA